MWWNRIAGSHLTKSAIYFHGPLRAETRGAQTCRVALTWRMFGDCAIVSADECLDAARAERDRNHLMRGLLCRVLSRVPRLLGGRPVANA